MKLSQDNEELFHGIGPGDVAIDCGANIGVVTQKLADLGAFVFAFEPNPSAFAYLSNRFAAYPNVFCINKGVWDRNSSMRLYHFVEAHLDPLRYSYASSIFDTNPIVNTGNYTDIEVVDLCEIVEALDQRIKFLKVDIEGAEFELIEKLITSNMYRYIDLTLVETHEGLVQNPVEKMARLHSLMQERNITNINLNWN
ncbi:FkbM family methyltransferase [Paenibacillus sp. HJGM_3]|uniref:FkbM family methyltransferase n=1 Tax=Paenibacillus sp. HJGM_3 TaxID=3379816 RepID=UPI00385EC88E